MNQASVQYDMNTIGPGIPSLFIFTIEITQYLLIEIISYYLWENIIIMKNMNIGNCMTLGCTTSTQTYSFIVHSIPNI